MVKQKVIGSITFILAIAVLIFYTAIYFYFGPSEIMLDGPLDTFLAIYTISVDGLLGLICGVLLFKGIKAGYLIGMFIWGVASLLHAYEIYFISTQEGFDPAVHLEQYIILIDLMGLVTGICFIRWLFIDLNNESSEQLIALSHA
jgi:hypothetical protein